MKTLKVILVFSAIIFVLLSCSKKTTESLQTVSKPFFTPEEGTYATPQTVTISSTTLGVTILYTSDGTDPISSSTVYSNPLTISTTTTIKAKAFRDGWKDSQVASATYTITVPAGFISVPSGTFIMGDTRGEGTPYELPTHNVTQNTFYIGKYEVTQSEWQSIMSSNPASGFGVGDSYPVYNVSWYAILKYCNLRSLAEGLTPVYTINGSTDPDDWGAIPTSTNATWNAAICNWSANGYRLPTEAEWEYAARGATNNPDYLYSGSEDNSAVAWYYYTAGSGLPGHSAHPDYGSHPVGTKAPNGLNINDMSGNVSEWCWDWYSSYSSAPQTNPTGPASGSSRVLRGGYWDSSEITCRVSARSGSLPYGIGNSGFRLCRTN